MRRLRWILFIAAILLGIGLGLVFGWGLLPKNSVQSTFASLRNDYKTDTVLMIAEIYAKDQNLLAAVENLRRLGDATTPEDLRRYVTSAQSLGYSQQDLKWMTDLARAVEAAAPTQTNLTPGATP